MKKKVLLILLTLIFIVCLAFSFTACGKKDNDKEPGEIVSPGDDDDEPKDFNARIDGNYAVTNFDVKLGEMTRVGKYTKLTFTDPENNPEEAYWTLATTGVKVTTSKYKYLVFKVVQNDIAFHVKLVVGSSEFDLFGMKSGTGVFTVDLEQVSAEKLIGDEVDISLQIISMGPGFVKSSIVFESLYFSESLPVDETYTDASGFTVTDATASGDFQQTFTKTGAGATASVKKDYYVDTSADKYLDYTTLSVAGTYSVNAIKKDGTKVALIENSDKANATQRVDLAQKLGEYKDTFTLETTFSDTIMIGRTSIGSHTPYAFDNFSDYTSDTISEVVDDNDDSVRLDVTETGGLKISVAQPSYANVYNFYNVSNYPVLKFTVADLSQDASVSLQLVSGNSATNLVTATEAGTYSVDLTDVGLNGFASVALRIYVDGGIGSYAVVSSLTATDDGIKEMSDKVDEVFEGAVTWGGDAEATYADGKMTVTQKSGLGYSSVTKRFYVDTAKYPAIKITFDSVAGSWALKVTPDGGAEVALVPDSTKTGELYYYMPQTGAKWFTFAIFSVGGADSASVVVSDLESATSNLTSIENVKTLIAAIPQVDALDYDTDKAKVDAAREAYDKLIAADQAKIDTYSTLTAAEEKIAELGTAVREATLSKNPNKDTYVLGATLDITGAEISYELKNGTTGTIALDGEGVVLSGFDSETAGEKTIIVTYNGVHAGSFTVTVYEAIEASEIISLIDALPATDNLDYDENKAAVDNANTMYNVYLELNPNGASNITNADKLTAAVEKIAELGNQVRNIVVKGPKNNCAEKEGSFDLSGGTVKFVYYNGDETVEDLNGGLFTFTMPDTATPGEYTVKVLQDSTEIGSFTAIVRDLHFDNGLRSAWYSNNGVTVTYNDDGTMTATSEDERWETISKTFLIDVDRFPIMKVTMAKRAAEVGCNYSIKYTIDGEAEKVLVDNQGNPSQDLQHTLDLSSYKGQIYISIQFALWGIGQEITVKDIVSEQKPAVEVDPLLKDFTSSQASVVYNDDGTMTITAASDADWTGAEKTFTINTDQYSKMVITRAAKEATTGTTVTLKYSVNGAAEQVVGEFGSDVAQEMVIDLSSYTGEISVRVSIIMMAKGGTATITGIKLVEKTNEPNSELMNGWVSGNGHGVTTVVNADGSMDITGGVADYTCISKTITVNADAYSAIKFTFGARSATNGSNFVLKIDGSEVGGEQGNADTDVVVEYALDGKTGEVSISVEIWIATAGKVVTLKNIELVSKTPESPVENTPNSELMNGWVSGDGHGVTTVVNADGSMTITGGTVGQYTALIKTITVNADEYSDIKFTFAPRAATGGSNYNIKVGDTAWVEYQGNPDAEVVNTYSLADYSGEVSITFTIQICEISGIVTLNNIELVKKPNSELFEGWESTGTGGDHGVTTSINADGSMAVNGGAVGPYTGAYKTITVDADAYMAIKFTFAPMAANGGCSHVVKYQIGSESEVTWIDHAGSSDQMLVNELSIANYSGEISIKFTIMASGTSGIVTVYDIELVERPADVDEMLVGYASKNGVTVSYNNDGSMTLTNGANMYASAAKTYTVNTDEYSGITVSVNKLVAGVDCNYTVKYTINDGTEITLIENGGSTEENRTHTIDLSSYSGEISVQVSIVMMDVNKTVTVSAVELVAKVA